MNKVSIPVVRRVRFKDGRSLEILRQYTQNDRKHIDARVGPMMDRFFADGKGAGGFAFCIWDANGASCSAQSNFIGPVPSAGVPDFVRNLLMLQLAASW